MKVKAVSRVFSSAAITALAASIIGSALPAGAAPSGFADPAFVMVWNRTDAPVAGGAVKRSWYWGPQPNSGALQEDYAQGPGGKHMVQYFDKSRMEINNPNGDKSNPFYVTNGLLTRELISGYMQTGDNSFVLRWPAEIPLAGDTTDPTTPTYASFRGAIERKDTQATGSVVIAYITRLGELDFVHGAKTYLNYERYGVKNAYWEPATRHNIPDVFWSFLNLSGPVIINGKQTTARLSDPYFYATGYPISDAYWAGVVINGKPADVLIQAYERRVLTYVPTNPAGFKVQMGNVGRHYFDWRYRDAGKSKAVAGRCERRPELGFGKVYNDNPLVKIWLGCPQGAESRYVVTEQPFERGRMIAVKRYNFYAGQMYNEVFALGNDGAVQTFGFLPDNPQGGPNLGNPPSGLYNPGYPFAAVWAGQPSVKALGYATAPEQTQTLEGNGGGVVQYFDGGLMLYPNLAAKRIYVLYNVSGYAYVAQGPHLTLTDVNRWSVYEDKFGR